MIVRTIYSLFLVACLSLLSCKKEQPGKEAIASNSGAINYRQSMRDFVQLISSSGKSVNPDFIVIPQSGQELATTNGEPDGPIDSTYLLAIDGQGKEELFYGYDGNDNVFNNSDEQAIWQDGLARMRDEGEVILITDYCSTPSFMDNSFVQNQALNFLSFAADQRDLWSIPSYPNPIHNENTNDILHLSEAQNFIFIINTQNYLDKPSFIEALSTTNYDVIIMDAFFEDQSYTPSEIQSLSTKANGGSRLVIAYMSIGEAEDYRFYWQNTWSFSPPDWMEALNPDWPGNFKVQYWEPEWQSIIVGNNNSYLSRIQSAGFDGVYLDIIDAFDYFEGN